MLLFASSKAAADYKIAQFKRIVKEGQEVDDGLFYTTQVDGVGNACGASPTRFIVPSFADVRTLFL